MLTTADRASLTTSSRQRSLFRRVQLLPRILDHRNRSDLDIRELAVQLLGTADIDVLDNTPGFGVDHDRPARAVRVLPPPEERHRFIRRELSLRRLDQIENRDHPPSQALTERKLGIAV